MLLLMIYIMATSTLMVISSSNLLMSWFCLELNLFCFVPILMSKAMNNEVDATLNYFLPQATGSSIFIFSSLLMMTFPWFLWFWLILCLIALFMKSGIVPCHYWYPKVMSQSSWMCCLLLSTWQKIAPMFLLFFMMTSKTNYPMTMLAPLNAIFGGIAGLNQTSLKKIMAYSSISHMGWMLSASLTNTPCLFLVYLLLYFTIITPLFFLFNLIKLEKIHDISKKQNSSFTQIITILTLLLSLSGLPPLSGFIQKLLMMSMLINHSINIVFLLIIGSVMNLFFYLNITMNSVMSLQNYHFKFLKFNINQNMIFTLIASNFFGLFLIMI